jgi:hypothetical protein
MKTDELIRALAADNPGRVVPIARSLHISLLAGVVLSAALFLALLHPRHDIAEAVQTFRFLFKFILAGSLAVTAITFLSDAAVPVSRRHYRGLLIPAVLIAVGVLVELTNVPSHEWAARLLGHNATHCLSLIPLLSLAPAVCLLVALRHGAPARPMLAGAACGLVAGSIGSLLYALTCPDDSPLFVATWYTIGVAIVTIASAFIGRRALRW